MYKIVFVVAVFAFALQGALGSPLAEVESAQQVDKLPNSEVLSKSAPAAVENKPADGDTALSTSTSSADVSTTTSAPKSGASSSEICMLLVQVSSLALVAKHMLL